MAAIYRPLDPSRNEIRLLKILPPENPSSPPPDDPLGISADCVRCELQYESLDELHRHMNVMQAIQSSLLEVLLQDSPNTTDSHETEPRGVRTRTVANILSLDFDSHYEIDPKRKDALRNVYDSDVKTMESWLPAELHGNSPTFEKWLDSWIWTSLSGNETHLQRQSSGYLALSYVWKDSLDNHSVLGTRYREMEEMVAAGGSSARQVLESSGNSNLLEEIFGGKEGVAANTTEIIVDGRPVIVGKNLEKALRTLREIPEVKNGVRVWVDALCINQSNISEKNVEVKRMGDIYKKAERVVSWLGDERDQSGLALEFMSTLGRFTRSLEDAAAISRSFYQNIHTDAAIRVTQLLLRAYWKRIW
jgi:Heterokaryon incompatibility protein (HET)